jgi:large subunit ribosomal protein L20
MTRSVNTVASRERRRNILKLTKGYYGRRKNVWTVAKNAYERAKKYSYRDKRTKKRAFKSLWIQRINAATRDLGFSYSRVISKLLSNNKNINRKILADMAMNDMNSFKNLLA